MKLIAIIIVLYDDKNTNKMKETPNEFIYFILFLGLTIQPTMRLQRHQACNKITNMSIPLAIPPNRCRHLTCKIFSKFDVIITCKQRDLALSPFISQSQCVICQLSLVFAALSLNISSTTQEKQNKSTTAKSKRKFQSNMAVKSVE